MFSYNLIINKYYGIKMNSIESVKLFEKLKNKDTQFASKVLETSNLIEELINKKTTINFPNYTNHDINHSINIMNTMYELIQSNIDDFNQLELALMIYASLFHDIGMSLGDDEISKIKDSTSKYLYSQSFEQIKKNSTNEELALQEVIRTQHGKIANDLVTNKYKEYFLLPNTSISFAQDLGLICQSHTERERYLSKLHVDSLKGEYSYNPQFIAILLRVADILDIDSTRTPLELYKSMDLNEYSNEEWLKNLTIENTKKIFVKNDLKIVRLDGNVKDIKVHRKLLNYIEWIENELRLAVEKTADMQEKYRLHLNTKVQNNIQPIGYTIPDLKLNMDYKAVTKLLMGESVYGSKALGLRELLQNSIDACMVKKEKLQSDYKPTIEINIFKDKNQVIVKDNGMGMNENIIKKYFLNVGKSYYKSSDFLNYEHTYNPIGNFGIGFLSCFMLSSHVKVMTKYHGDKYMYRIDLEQESEYISFSQDEDYTVESGTQIILNYESLVKAMEFKEDDFERLLLDFITDNILIEEFEIKINGITIKQKNTIKTSEHIININKYAKNLYGRECSKFCVSIQ
ncbi:ATP-binding protein [Sulfurospirillum halorespirans DSM 13726]|uniref:ATP-binding protein n=2 Tax=Sulfurospirillum halorespirans TaxID=194424 RepID=A0A1D7TIX1_9BACT|nr:ATP-binding protein [Sulfurospirillum halorespirans DSM 13726]